LKNWQANKIIRILLHTTLPETTLLKLSPYIAPELYQEKKDVHEATDLFSVGVIFFEMLTGHPPNLRIWGHHTYFIIDIYLALGKEKVWQG